MSIGHGRTKLLVNCFAHRHAASRQGIDSFLMGPSGFGFTHPSAIAVQDSIRQTLVKLTAHAATSLDMIAYVHWDDYDNEASKLASVERDVTDSTTPTLHQQGFLMAGSLSDINRQDQHQQLSYSTSMVKNELYPGGVVSNQNTFAMEQYIAEFVNSSIRAVFSPITPFVHQHIGDVVTFRELVRWTNSASATPSVIAEMLTKLPKGTMGYVYKLPDIFMHEVEALGQVLKGTHVKLVGHRELVSSASQVM